MEGTFVTSKDGSPLPYTSWYSGEPNNSGGEENCITLWTGLKKWIDSTCDMTYAAVCEIPWEEWL